MHQNNFHTFSNENYINFYFQFQQNHQHKWWPHQHTLYMFIESYTKFSESFRGKKNEDGYWNLFVLYSQHHQEMKKKRKENFLFSIAG